MPRWRPTSDQVLWAIRVIVVVFLALIVVALLGAVLWVVLDIYINPRTATERKDLVQSFAIVVAGVVGSLSALAAVGNLYISRKNLQQERELESERAQEDVLPAYLDQMIELLNDEDRPLRQAMEGDEVSIQARVRTLTVLPRLDGSRKTTVMQFLSEAGLITQGQRDLLHDPAMPSWRKTIVDLTGADLSKADLRNKIDLHEANLEKVNLSGANLSNVNLSGAVLSRADLSDADLSDADLSGADLRSAHLFYANLGYANLGNANLSGATLIKVDMSRVNLSDAHLNYATLVEADLSGVNLSRTDLSGAELERANLSGASGITNENLMRQTFRLEGATMPNGQKYEDWLKSKDRGEDGENSSP